ncbi:MAG: GIY-YIG nuclease family protein [Chloroflexi bacterium]|nr:GIY-YIG nuclease family protein [Chloroflexota bacterium]
MQAGTYCLVVHVPLSIPVSIGCLSRFVLTPGYYLYLGSALNGLEGRLDRHLRRDKRLRWHIDHLLTAGQVVETWCVASGERQECAWAQAALGAPGARMAIKGFGASDCRCPAHLVHFRCRPTPDLIFDGTVKLRRTVYG